MIMYTTHIHLGYKFFLFLSLMPTSQKQNGWSSFKVDIPTHAHLFSENTSQGFTLTLTSTVYYFQYSQL